VRTLVIQFGRLGDVIQTTPLLRDLAASDSQDGIDLLLVHPNQTALSGLSGIAQMRTVRLEAKLLDDQIATGFAQGRIPKEAPALLDALNLPQYGRVIHASHAALGCWLAGHISCEQREGGIIGDAGECLYEGAAHTYRVALLAFRERNWFNVVDLIRCSAERCTPPQPASRPYVSTSERLSFALPAGRKVALNVGASEPHRCWPPEHFARLAEALTAAGLTPILVGAPSERDLGAKVEALCRTPLAGFFETPIAEMAKLLSLVDLLVSVDTGAVHIAAAVGCKVVSLSGASVYFAETAPWGAGHLILQGRLGAPMAQLEPNLVLTAALHRLGLADQASLRTELARRGQQAWETRFLPPEADPLGGISYWPLHEYVPRAEELFTRALRHLFALEFRGGVGSVSLDYLRDLFVGRESLVQEADCRLQTMTPIVQTLDQMSAAASKCEEVSTRRDPEAGAAVKRLAPKLMEGLQALLARTAKADALAFQPVMHYLDWRLRMMPVMPPRETFAYHAQEYEAAAAMLRRCGALVRGVLRAERGLNDKRCIQRSAISQT
jgi:ADP-heptose:LPS heptosyltransferase